VLSKNSIKTNKLSVYLIQLFTLQMCVAGSIFPCAPNDSRNEASQ